MVELTATLPTASRRIAASIRTVVVFPFEPSLYNNGRHVAEFVGHPLLDLVRATRSREETLARYHLDPARRVLAILPGSRKKELRWLPFVGWGLMASNISSITYCFCRKFCPKRLRG